MAKYTTEIIEEKKVWDSFILKQSPQTFLQSWNWGETNSLEGKKIFRIGILEKDKIVGEYLAIKENARRGSHLLVPGGPFIDWSNSHLAKYFLTSIWDLAKKEKVWFVRIRPELIDNPSHQLLFKRNGFQSSPMHLHAENTWVLDINKDEETLLYGMRKNTRYNVRKSLTAGLTFDISTNPDDSEILKRLQEETVERHKFTGFPESIFKSQIKTFGQDGEGALFLCKKNKEILAAAIIIFYGKIAYYHHSASTSNYPDIPFSYFLQWNIIQEAKKRGCTHYNFWGIAPNDNPQHRFAGVTIFKKGFGGERIDWLHAQDLPIYPSYWATYIFEMARKKLRKL